MTAPAWFTVGTLAATIAILAFTRYGTDLVLLAALTFLLTLGVLSPHDAMAGFGSEAVLTNAALFVVVTGLRETQAVGIIAQRLLARPSSVASGRARLMFVSTGVSAFVNNTPLVAMLIPVVREWARLGRLSVSHLMIPMNYAVILGGVCTLIGTSTNLVVNGLLVSQAGHPGLGLFDPTWVGLPCAAVGILYLMVIGPRLLPDRRPAVSMSDDPREYTVQVEVEPGGPLTGRTIERAQLRHLPGLFLVGIERDEQVLPAVAPDERLRDGDRLVFAGVLASVVDLQKLRGLRPATNQVSKLDSPRSHRCLIEAVVSNTCPLVGQSIREGRFRTVYNAAVLAVARNGERLNCKIGDVVLQPGDTLLLEAHPWFAVQNRNSRDFFLVSAVEDSTPPRHERAGLALAILAGMAMAAGSGLLPLLAATWVAAGLMIVSGCCSAADARRGVDWSVLVVIAASLGLGKAMQVSGAAAAVAPVVVRAAGDNPWLALTLVYGVTLLFAEVISHAAAATLVFPIAVATAGALGVSIVPYAMAILIAASCSFASPIGYATHLMVFGPGGYYFSDYVRIGGPLDLLVGAVAITLTPLVWPF
jgi:di/tricarboxylate transporter